jgi:hypothetical protein
MSVDTSGISTVRRFEAGGDDLVHCAGLTTKSVCRSDLTRFMRQAGPWTNRYELVVAEMHRRMGLRSSLRRHGALQVSVVHRQIAATRNSGAPSGAR